MVDEDLIQIGSRLRALRLAKGLTQEELGEKAELHPTYVGGVERGERNLGFKNLLRFARALDISPSKMLETIDIK